MTFESTQIPSERIPPIATDVSGGAKTAAGVLFFLCAIMLCAMLGMLVDGDRPGDDVRRNSAEAAGHAAGTAIGVFLIAGLPGIFGFRAARNASRATRAAKTAASDPSYTWRLSGKLVVGADGAGVPRPEVTFKVSGKARTMLLAAPTARVVG